MSLAEFVAMNLSGTQQNALAVPPVPKPVPRVVERAKYRRGELVQANEMLLASVERRPSGYMHPEIASQLPKQTLLLEKITEEE
jgi:hypothetical protein